MLAADRYIGDLDYLAERQLKDQLAQLIANKEGILTKEKLEYTGDIVYQADLFVFTREQLNELISNIQKEMLYHRPFAFPPIGFKE
jgi:hypothetical protein